MTAISKKVAFAQLYLVKEQSESDELLESWLWSESEFSKFFCFCSPPVLKNFFGRYSELEKSSFCSLTFSDSELLTSSELVELTYLVLPKFNW